MTVDLIDQGAGVRAAFSGLQTCGSVWACPCCSAAISEARRGEMNEMLAWARTKGLQPVMVTLTARHGVEDVLRPLLDAVKRAKQALHRHRTWVALKPQIAGSVTATEITYGRNGWHPHLHMILLVRAGDQADACAAVEALRGAWGESLRGAGLDGNGAAFQIQGAGEAGRYIAKWGAAEEMTMNGEKQGRKGGRNPAQLLADNTDRGDKQAGELWRIYALTFHGRRQLVWSRGLKAAVGIGEVSDDDAAREQNGETRREIAHIEHAQWAGRDGARRRRGRILDAAEDEGASGVARVVSEGGEDPRPEPVGSVIEDSPPTPPDRWTPLPMRPGGLAERAAALIARASPAQAPPGPKQLAAGGPRQGRRRVA